MVLFEHEAAAELTELQRLRRAAEDNTEPPQLLYSSNELTERLISHTQRKSLDSLTSSCTNCVKTLNDGREHSPGRLPLLHSFNVN